MSNQRSYQKSLKLYESSKRFLIPGGSTISKRPDLFPFGVYPVYLEKGNGAIVTDVDQNEYIDFQSALGAIILGYNYSTTNQVIEKQLKQGVLFSLSTPLSIKLAEKICHHIPCAERVRILKNGSDATSAAVRIARAYTGRTKIVYCHYHGWHDWYYITTALNRGIPKDLSKNIIYSEYGNIDKLRQIIADNKDEIAAIITEPVNLENHPHHFLPELRQITKDNNILLIFDEVVTGFRFALGGGQSYFGVTPDIACFAKALGNGVAIAAVAGLEEIMESTKDVISTQTYAEECLALASAISTIEVLEKNPVIEHIWNLGLYFQESYNQLAKAYNIPTKCIGFPPRLELRFKSMKGWTPKEIKSYFLQETANDGILFGHHIFMTYSHTQEHINVAVKSCENIFKTLSTADSFELRGNPVVELW
jgi:glutamate-1-semialdehyde aminotransferase